MTFKVTIHPNGCIPEITIETERWMVFTRTYGWHDKTPDLTRMSFDVEPTTSYHRELGDRAEAVRDAQLQKVRAALEAEGAAYVHHRDYGARFTIMVNGWYSRKRELTELVARTAEGMNSIND